MLNYILDEKGAPLAEPDILKWACWFEKANRQVGLETIRDSQISTVFLGTDHAWNGGPPVLWETMIFSKEPALDRFQKRCTGSREQAEAMHIEAVEMVNAFYHKLDCSPAPAPAPIEAHWEPTGKNARTPQGVYERWELKTPCGKILNYEYRPTKGTTR